MYNSSCMHHPHSCSIDVFENFPVMPEDSLANGLAGLGQVRADDSCVEDTAESAAYSASLNPQTTFTTLTSLSPEPTPDTTSACTPDLGADHALSNLMETERSDVMHRLVWSEDDTKPITVMPVTAPRPLPAFAVDACCVHARRQRRRRQHRRRR